ncbi:nuclear transport factor 2 family protein [bacterium]|nr:nuclear transport factor 2 family protein [bacterium]
MSTARDEARAIVEQIVAAYNAKDADAIAALYHPDARYWSALGDWQEGLAEIKGHVEELHRTLPNEQMEILSLIGGEGVAIAEFRSTGTTPSGDTYAVEFTEVIELRDGLISQVKVYLDPEEIQAVMG